MRHAKKPKLFPLPGREKRKGASHNFFVDLFPVWLPPLLLYKSFNLLTLIDACNATWYIKP